MNDRFQFRVWAKPDEKTDTEGYYIDDADYMVMHPNGTVEISYYVDDGYAGKIDRFEQDEIIIEQCTGYKDKNGNLIYEHDLIKSPNNSNLLEVVWEKGVWQTKEYRENGRHELFLHILATEYGVEIVGDIHEVKEEQ